MQNLIRILALGQLGLQAAQAVDPLLLHRAACNGDNCARVVTATVGPATSIPLSVRKSDCQAFLDVTVTPATSTISNTVTVTPAVSTVGTSTVYVYTTTVATTTTVAPAANHKRAVTTNGPVYNSGTAVPSYVSTTCGTGSTSLSRYSSACACFGLRGSTTTLPTPSTTTTISVTAATPLTTVSTTISTATTTTSTVTAVADSDCPTSTVTVDGFIFFSVTCDQKFVPSQYDYGSVVSGLASLQDCLVSCDTANMHFGDECSAVNYYTIAADGYDAGTCVYLPLDTLPLSRVPDVGVKAVIRL